MNLKTALPLVAAALTPLPSIGQVLITQYYEGTSNNKWIEIQNTGASTVSLAGYQLTLWTNAAAENWKTATTASANSILDLTSVSLPPGAHYLIANGSAALPAYAVGDTTAAVANFNGNDSIVLYNGSVDPANIVDALSFTNTGSEGTNTSFYRLNNDPGFDLTAGTSITGFTSVWQQIAHADVDTADAADPFYLNALGLVGSLDISIDTSSVAENAGFGVATLTIERLGGTAGDLVVNVSSNDPGEAVVQSPTVTLADGEASGTVSVDVLDDLWPDGDQTVTFTASAAGFDPVTVTLMVTDDGSDAFSVVVHEVYYAVDASMEDANGDGVTNTSSPVLDEFIEVYNPTASAIDLSGYTMLDTFGSIHLFPPDTMLPPGGAIVVFAGGDISEGSSAGFGTTPIQLSTNGGLFLNDNGTDTIFIRNTFDQEVFALPLPDQTASSAGGSLTLATDGDPSSGYVLHTSLAAASFSPGTRSDGTPFILISDNLGLTVNTAAMLENAAFVEGALTLSIPSALDDDLIIHLTSSAEADLILETPVTLPAGETSVNVDAFPVDDALPDGDVVVEITAMAPGYLNATGSVTVEDDGDVLPPMANLVITEIMFNPASDESSPGVGEWIEIYNAGSETVDLSGYKLDDEDTTDWGTIGSGSLPAGQFAVIFDGTFTDDTTFRSEWGVPADALVIGVDWGNLSNSPGIGNEVIQILDGFSRVVDIVDLDDDGTIWPADDGAGSTALLASAMNSSDNDLGTHWILSGAESFSPTGPVFATTDVGSPGQATPTGTSGGGYSDWVTDNEVTLGPDGDDDGDGISNLVEYALGLDPQVPDGSPGSFDGSTLSFAKTAGQRTDITYEIETSTDLGIADPWEVVTPDLNDSTVISFTLPTAEARLFARLKVTQN